MTEFRRQEIPTTLVDWFQCLLTGFLHTASWVRILGVFSSKTHVTLVRLTEMCNSNNPALQAERVVLLSDNSDLVYQGHIGIRLCTVWCQ